MEVGVRALVRPSLSVLLVSFVAGGILLGTISGLTPGLHANTFAALAVGVAPAIPGPTAGVALAILAAGTVHTFLDVVPALAFGVPDAAMAPTALPGHRLVIAGRGREGLRLSALGSGLAVAFAVPLSVPVTALMRRIVPVAYAHLPIVLGGVAAMLVLTESSRRAAVGAALAVAASGGLGVVALDLSVSGLLGNGTVLTPLFSGLFGAPVLLDALDGGGVPGQSGTAVTTSRRTVVELALIGTCAGAVVSYLPGVSSAVAATAALLGTRGGGPRQFLVTTSAVNTATAVFALFSLVALNAPHTGVTVALGALSPRPPLSWLVATVVVAATVGFLAVPVAGDRYLRMAGAVDYGRVSLGLLGLLVVLSGVVAGPVGVGLFAAATVVGSIPPLFGARRSALMGVLLVPLAL
ncbi:MAG: tripartite tricarboxylate transporter permease [Haloarculaceae archaeon]